MIYDNEQFMIEYRRDSSSHWVLLYNRLSADEANKLLAQLRSEYPIDRYKIIFRCLPHSSNQW